ncbi:MAG: 1,4-alpha-glucan branching protein GlgB [Gammaproteobacteria bacterium]|nr:1,4-alpha-glucan branching protein GlgB [Gammaproteobacteria bacterium]
MTTFIKNKSDDLKKIAAARHHDPFSLLGLHRHAGQASVCIYAPDGEHLTLGSGTLPMARIPNSDFFFWHGDDQAISDHYQVTMIDKQGLTREFHDPYCFPAQISDNDIYLFAEGKHWYVYNTLGANAHSVAGIEGTLFATWAPNAERVSVIGDFNRWDGRNHPMRCRGSSGVWEIFIPELCAGALYKFEIRNRQSGEVMRKIDPYGRQFELRPETASIICHQSTYQWSDQEWIQARAQHDWLHQPMSIYEVHLGSWQRDEQGDFLNYRELAHRLVAHMQQTGFTHIELLPITEHPLDASWGYQTTGYYAPTSRHGSVDDFRYFIDYCHQHHIGVLLDWVPAHFPKDAHGLARFDGSALYEHEDPRRGEHRDWGTLIYNYNRNEVKNFLIASALFWLEEMHLDGLRVDAVASMLYLDYSREANDWIPNIHGGNENIEAVAFMRELNALTHQRHPGTMIIAEESTAWPQVTNPTDSGGLGFSMKWNMGWMHDTLNYFAKDPVHRTHHHQQLTFGLLYLFTENFVLPFSHDEVVHGKGSMINKMPGDEWQRFANLRLLYTYMFTYPGKKLLFMGCEFAQGNEWNHEQALDWYTLQYPGHNGVKQLLSDLNHLYKKEAALHRHDFEEKGFSWLNCDDSQHSILSYERKTDNETIITVLNFTPIPRNHYRIGVSDSGNYHEIFNSDAEVYNGSQHGYNGNIVAEHTASMGHPWSITLTLPPLSGIIIKRKNE